MTYLYLISSFGTYVIPTIFSFGLGGMNGLALDDTQTGLIGIGALISVIGLYFIFSKKKSIRLLQIAEVTTWISTMFVLMGEGYAVELNETYYGFGNSGLPPNGGAGYLYDLAYMNGHLMFAFFLMPVLAVLLLGVILFIKKGSKYTDIGAYLSIAGTILGAAGVMVYLVTLSWYIEAAGLILVVFAMIFLLYAPINAYRRELHNYNR